MNDLTDLVVRRLGPGDADLLAALAREDADFDLEERGEPRRPLAPADAAAYLADPAVLHWVAELDSRVVGHLLCNHLRRRCGDASELLLFEIGVRAAYRRRGVGRRLVAEMDAWMLEHGVAEVWVLGDNVGAEAFYRACGFRREADQPVYLTRRVETGSPPRA